jgi:hypothetical protein
MRGRLAPVLRSLAGLLVVFAICELGARIYKGEWRAANFLAEGVDLFRSAYPSAFDPRLGWIPRPGTASAENIWGTDVTIGEEGIRSNGAATPAPAADAPVVLAVGDSFTFGDEVSDRETWPAQLARVTGWRVLNAGVFGYGVDQCWLRIEQLAPAFRPDAVILSFIPADIERCELKERSAVPKPYFTLEGDSLALEVGHVVFAEHPLGPVRRLLGRSYVLHLLMTRLAPRWWLEGRWRSQRVHHDGDEVVCRILGALADHARREGYVAVVLAQRGKRPSARRLARVDRALACARAESLLVVDLRQPLDDLARHDPDRYDRLFAGHMTPEGNRFTAEIVARALAPRLAARSGRVPTDGR